MTGTAIEALTAQETGEIFLITADIAVDGEILFRLVNNTENLSSRGNVYEAFAFTFVLPGTSDSGVKSASFELDNVDRRIQEEVTKAAGKEITAAFNIILASDPDVIERGPYKYILRDFQVTRQRIRAALYDFYLTDLNIPGLRYTPQNFPGLF
ncbi:MAG: DUF1833 domain-containing protein [Treponema sp.]|jgi:hypothetical protein|nr:DUF1833 domain-containing protein [Treponema sp.]